MPTLTKFDSVFSPLISQFTKKDDPLDKLENEFVQRMTTLVQAESNSLIKSLKSATSEEDIDKAKWNLIPRMQQLLWYLWRDGWALGKNDAIKSLRMAGFSTGDNWAEFAFQSDNNTGNRRSQRDRISDLKTNLEDSRVKKAIEDRTLELSKDFDKNTKDEIKNAFRDFNKDKDREGARARLEERIQRAIGANDGQDEKKVRRTAARAKRIARTELNGAYNTARVDSFVSAGVTKFIWITDVRETTCEVCLPRNGVIYDISEIPSNPPPVHPYCGCSLQPVRDDDPRVKKQKKGVIEKIAPIAAGWLLGKAASKVSESVMAEIDKLPDREKKENDLWNKLLLAGGAALGLAGIYYLVTRNPTVKQVTQRATKEAVEEVADQVEVYRQRKQAQEGLSEEDQPSVLDQGAITAASLPPEVRNRLPPGLANSNADIRNMPVSEIIRRTGLSPKEASRLKLQLEEYLADNPVAPQQTLDRMTNKQLKELGLTNKQVSELRRLKRQGQTFATIDDLRKIKGVGDRKIEEMKRRLEEKNSPSLVVNGQKIEELSVRDLKYFLKLSTDQAVAVKQYLSKNRITSIQDLKNVPGLGEAAVGKAFYALTMIRPRENINNYNSDLALKSLAQRTGLSEKVAQAIIDEIKENGDFNDMDEMIDRVEKRLISTGVRKNRLGKATRNKIEDNLTVLPRGEDERPIDLPPEKPKALPSLPQKRQPVGDPRVKPLPDNRVPKVRRASPQDRVNSDVLEDERQYQELAKEVQRYHTIPGTSSKITKQVKQRVEQNASIIKRQEENYRRVNDNVNQATARIDSLEADVAKLEEAYRTGQNIEEAKKTYLEAIARVEGNLDNASGVLSRVDELDNAIARTSRVRASAEQSIVNNPNRQRRQEALDAKLKAARANTTDLEEDLANINRNSILIVLKNEIDQLDRLSAILREDPSNIRGNIQNSKARLEELKNRVNQASQERASLKRQYKERFSILQQEINDVESQISEVRTRLNFADDKIQRYRVETARLRRDTKADPKDVARAERELKKWESTKNTASRELRSLDKRLTALKKQRKDNKDNRGFSRGGKLAMFVSNMRKRL